MSWNCHEHRGELRVSHHATVYHETQGMLCYAEVNYDVILWYPVQWRTRAAAQQWIERGCIAEIQESLGNLRVGFVNVLVQPNNHW